MARAIAFVVYFKKKFKYRQKKFATNFFCFLTQFRYLGTKRCLGTSKGRKYEPMDDTLRAQVDQIFREDNIALHKLLLRHNLPIPNWLRKHLSQSDYISWSLCVILFTTSYKLHADSFWFILISWNFLEFRILRKKAAEWFFLLRRQSFF